MTSLLGNLLLGGFDAAIDLRDAGTSLALHGAIGFSLATGVAHHEAPGGPLPDDDGGVDEAGRCAAAVLLRGRGPTSDSAHGLEGDNDPGGSQRRPVSAPRVYNGTLCGRGRPLEREHLGVMLRHGWRAELGNLLLGGFDAAIDLRDAGTSLALHGAIGVSLATGVAQHEAPGGPLPL